MMQLTLIEFWSFAASFASVILAVVAIILSMVLFNMSSKVSAKLQEAAAQIANNVTTLETHFSKYYGDQVRMTLSLQDRMLEAIPKLDFL